MLTALATVLGAITGIVPAVVDFFKKKEDNKHALDLAKLKLEHTRLQMEAFEKNIDLQIKLEESKAAADEGDSLRRHDSTLRGSKFIESLRASVRPVITYLFFLMFVIIKGSAAYVMIQNGNDIPTMLQAIWDTETMAIFGSIMGFWFGSRAIEKFRKS